MRMNYDSVRQDAKKLRALAEECEASAKTCVKYQNELSQYWAGTAADAYKDGLRQLKSKNLKLAQDIERIADLIRSVADEMEAEDRRIAAEIARKAAVAAAKKASSASRPAVLVAGSGNIGKAAGNAIRKTMLSSGTSATGKTGSSTLIGTVNDLVSRLFGKG